MKFLYVVLALTILNTALLLRKPTVVTREIVRETVKMEPVDITPVNELGIVEQPELREVAEVVEEETDEWKPIGPVSSYSKPPVTQPVEVKKKKTGFFRRRQ